MSYACTILWHERTRYLPAVLAVTFSALLIALQCGLLLGMLSVSSQPIDRIAADVWVGPRDVPSIGFSHPIPEAWRDRLARQPEVTRTEPYLFGFGSWYKPAGGTELCYVIGVRLEDSTLGAPGDLTPAMRARLTEPGAVVVNASDLEPLGLIRGVGEATEVGGRRVRVVGLVRGVKSIGMMPGLYCSLRTARLLLPALAARPDEASYLVARCASPADAARLANRLSRQYTDMSVLTRDEFSRRTRLHWLMKTKAGAALGFAAVLGLLVGAVITGQTLYAATAAAVREHAMLRALGIPRERIRALVVTQAFWVGAVGTGAALPLLWCSCHLARAFNIEMMLGGGLLAATAGLTLVMAVLAGLTALRSLRLAEPVALLR
jgi:putative ABC transport system permease protein